jgi:hypothetical protein
MDMITHEQCIFFSDSALFIIPAEAGIQILLKCLYLGSSFHLSAGGRRGCAELIRGITE